MMNNIVGNNRAPGLSVPWGCSSPLSSPEVQVRFLFIGKEVRTKAKGK